MHEALKHALPDEYDEADWADFSSRLYYASFDFDAVDTYINKLKEQLTPLERKYQTAGNRIFYLGNPSYCF